MNELTMSPCFGMTVTILTYWMGVKIQQKTKSPLANPMIISIVLIIILLNIFQIPYDNYFVGGYLFHMFIAPATACLGVTIYKQLPLLKKNFLPVIVGSIVGSFTAVFSTLLMCKLFQLDRVITISLLPKSVTNAIATAISADYGGIVSVTVAGVVIAGVGGNLLVPYLGKLFRVKDPVAEGLAIGACSHALGTAKALELGDTQAAMSGLAMGICGIITALIALSFPYIV